MLTPGVRFESNETGASESRGVEETSGPPPRAGVLGGPKNESRPWNHSKNLVILTQIGDGNQSERISDAIEANDPQVKTTL